MSDVQRLIRKLQPKGPRSFDEHMWPIYLAIVVLCGYLVGVVVAWCTFTDERIHANALTWLFAISVLGLAALFSVRFLKSSLLRRTLVLSMLLSLIVNISLMLMLAWTSIFADPWDEKNPRRVAQEEQREVVIPEYSLFNQDEKQRVPQEFEKPVETGEPNAEERVELTRQSTQPMQELADIAPTIRSTVNQEQTSTKPNRVDTPSTPRQSATMSKLSYQPRKREPSTQRAVKSPSQATSSQVAASTSQSSQASASASATVRKQDSNSQTNSRTSQPNERVAKSSPNANAESETQATVRVPKAQLARKSDAANPDNAIASLPTLRRKLQRPTNLPPTDTPVDDRLSKSKRVEESVEANSTLLTKRSTKAPADVKEVELQPKIAVNVQRRTQMDQPESETLSSSASRSSLQTQRRADTSANAPSVEPSPSQPAVEQLTASAPNVKQQKTTAPSEAKARAPSSDSNDTMSPSSQAVARATAKSQPSLANKLASRKSPVRARMAAKQISSPSTEVPNVAEARSQADSPSPATKPSRLALARSNIGVAGVGAASNLDSGVAAPETPLNIPSASANRATATQEMKTGPALTPSTQSLARQMRARENAPRTSMQAQPISTAMVPGSSSPMAEAASSAATMQQRASNAAASSVTAAKGRTEVDLGTPRIAADLESGRAEGGGQPEISTGEQPRSLERNDLVAGNSSVKTPIDAPNAGSPLAQDVATESVEANASGTTMARAESSDNAMPGGADQVGAPAAEESGTLRIAQATSQRADSGSSSAMPTVAAGGTTSPGRSARSLAVRTSSKSDTPSLASDTASDGSRQGVELDAVGARPQRSAAGAIVDSQADWGAVAADDIVNGSPEGLVSPDFQRSGDTGDVGQSFAISDNDVGAPERSRRPRAVGTSTNVELDPQEFAANAPGNNQADQLVDNDSVSPDNGNLDGDNSGTDTGVARQTSGREPTLAEAMANATGRLLVDLDAEVGLGGLGDTPDLDVGIVSRSSSDESELVSLQPARFLRRTRPGAAVATQTNVVTPTKAFRRRVIRKGDELAGERGFPSPKTEASIELGLVFLSRFQSADGSWSFRSFAQGKAELPDGEDAIMVSDTAATSLALLSYLGAGYHHRADKYQERVKSGIDFLVQRQKEDGDLYIDQDENSSRSAWLYSHAIATLALCEAYGMTQDPELRGPAQKALNFVMEAQHPKRGGWRYSPAYGSDTSVSGWMLMALKSGELADLSVSTDVYQRVTRWLDLAQASDAQPYLFRYNPYAPDTEQQRHGRKPTRAITAVGLLMRLYTGWKRDDANMLLGARTLAQNPPELGTSSRPRRDTYYWYYATQVMFHMGGKYWANWNSQLHPMLTSSQVKEGALAGSWNPQSPVPDRWGSYGGRLYVTTMNLLSLEVFYRHLPLYEDTGK